MDVNQHRSKGKRHLCSLQHFNVLDQSLCDIPGKNRWLDPLPEIPDVIGG